MINAEREKGRDQLERQNRSRAFVFLLLGIILVLGVLLAGVSISYHSYRQSVIAAMSPYSEPDLEDKQDEIEKDEQKEDVVTIEALQRYAQEYNVGSEFLQQFFDDVFVYKEDGAIIYEPVDPTLAKNNYDWQCLSRENGRMSYHDGVVSAARGIDVSTYQGEIDWEKVAADGVDFAMIRLGYRGYGTGKLMFDEYFARNIQGATDAGVAVGVYFFSQAIHEEEAVEEAQMVLEAIADYPVTYPVVFDTEAVPEDARTADMDIETLTDCAVAFCETIKEAGYRPMIYSNSRWLIREMDFSRLEPYDIWLAQYFRKPFFPYEFEMWQYTSTGTVDGIEGDVDWNLCFADYGTSETTEADADLSDSVDSTE